MARWTLFGPTGPQTLTEQPTNVPAEHFLWLDICLDETAPWQHTLEQLTGKHLDELHIDDLNNPLHPSHFDSGEGYSRLIFRSLSNKPLFDERHTLSIKTRPTYFLLFEHILVSFHVQESRTFQHAEHYFNAQQPQSNADSFLAFKKLPESPAELLTQLISHLTDQFLDIRTELSDRLERWQRDLLNPRKKFGDWTALLAIRAELNKLESLAEDQFDTLQDWEEELLKNGKVRKVIQVNLSDTREHVKRLIKLADRLGANTEAAVQLHFSSTAHKTNEVMTLLTMMSVIFMPLTLITGLFGMNFSNMPWIQSPWGFWASLALMACSALASLAFILHLARKPKSNELRPTKRQTSPHPQNQSPDTPQNPKPPEKTK